MEPELNAYQFFKLVAMPFGATGCVYGFNRRSRALQYLAGWLLSLLATNYSDDFPRLSPGPPADSADQSLKQFLTLLGWAWKSGDADKGFAPTVSALGVELRLAEAVAAGTLTVANKASRVERIRADPGSILQSGLLSPAAAAVLRGKLQYTCAQIFGRRGRRACRAIGTRALQGGGARRLGPEIERALRWWGALFRCCAAAADRAPLL